jgi:hypothetical protein
MALGAVVLVASVAVHGQGPKEPAAGVVEFHLRNDVTVVAYSGGCRGTTVQAEFEYDAAGPRSVQTIKFGFNGIYPEGPRLRVQADGKTYDLGKVRRLRFEANRACRNLAVATGVSADRAAFLRVLKAKTIVMLIGDKKMEVGSADVEGLRALARRLQ